MSDKEIYVTLKAEGESEIIEKKSRFIGHAKHVTTEKEAIEYINTMKHIYADASHNVYAYVIKNNNISRYSDDGEPQGTAGIPTLDIIKKGEFTDAVIVVTRYFGGTLLGTGGLVRAYSAAAKSAVDEAKIVSYEKYLEFRLSASYSDFEKIKKIFSIKEVKIDSIEYGENVDINAAVKKADFDAVIENITENTAGRVKCEVTGDRFDC